MTLVSSVSAMTNVEGRDRDLLRALQQAEEARLDLAQRLVNAQEAECRRVGQELHDGIGQTLAMLTMDLETARQALIGLSPETHARLAGISDKLKNLGHDVANLSHRLHSSKLEFLGLAVAVKALSREWAEQYQVQARCECSGVPDGLEARDDLLQRGLPVGLPAQVGVVLGELRVAEDHVLVHEREAEL